MIPIQKVELLNNNVKTTLQEELIYFICQNILGRGKRKEMC
jgi:hypothetical protein